MPYEVYLYTLPRVTGDGKSIPGPDSKRHEFASVDDARTFAAEQKGVFDRVVLIENAGGAQKLVQRYMDGTEA